MDSVEARRPKFWRHPDAQGAGPRLLAPLPTLLAALPPLWLLLLLLHPRFRISTLLALSLLHTPLSQPAWLSCRIVPCGVLRRLRTKKDAQHREPSVGEHSSGISGDCSVRVAASLLETHHPPGRCTIR